MSEPRESLENSIKSLIDSEYPTLICDNYTKAIIRKIDDFVDGLNDTEVQIESSNLRLKSSKKRLSVGDCSKGSILCDIDEIESIDPDFKEGEKLRETLDTSDQSYDMNDEYTEDDTAGFREELLGIWEQALLKMAESNGIDDIDKTEKFIDSLRGWLTFIGTQNKNDGYLWGLNPGDFNAKEKTELITVSKIFKDDENVKRLTDLLGRTDSVDDIETYALATPGGNSKDKNGQEEISGITLGNDIANLLPSELILLQDEDLSIIFDLKYAEKRLLSFSKEGYAYLNENETGLSPNEIGHIGPIILVVDTSGSMVPVQRSVKGLVFTIASRAANQNRPVYLIDFNVNAKCKDIAPSRSIAELKGFIDSRFNGGTDIRAAIDAALQTTSDNRYENADILIISDFGLNLKHLSKDRDVIRKLIKKGTRFHSIVFGPMRKGTEYFDSRWRFSGNTILPEDSSVPLGHEYRYDEEYRSHYKYIYQTR